MEGAGAALPAGDVSSKYQKLAAEYSKLRVHVKVLKKGVLDEQALSAELRELIKQKEKAMRKSELEIDSLSFRNTQLTRRISVLQDELEVLQTKSNKKGKSKTEEKASTSGSSTHPPLDSGLLQEELQKKIIENAQFASQLSDCVFEISQLQATLADYQKMISETDSKYKCEIAKLKNKNQELQYSLDEFSKQPSNGTPSSRLHAGAGQSCNGDFLSEGGSIMGSEDALSSVDDLNVNEQLCLKTQLLEQENQRLKMECGLMQMENDSLKLEIMKQSSSSHKRSRSECHDSGDFNSFGETTIDGAGRLIGLLGSMEVPFDLSEEVKAREEKIQKYFRSKITELTAEKQALEGKTEHYAKECEMLLMRFELAEMAKDCNDRTLQNKHETISRLEEELHSTSTNYEEQMSVLTEHVADLNDKLCQQYEEILRLKGELGRRK